MRLLIWLGRPDKSLWGRMEEETVGNGRLYVSRPSIGWVGSTYLPATSSVSLKHQESHVNER